jgi:hypothetical protein
MVTLTALVPPGFGGCAWFELSLEWLHAVTDNTAAATKAVAAGQLLDDRRLAWTVRITVDRFPFSTARRATAA